MTASDKSGLANPRASRRVSLRRAIASVPPGRWGVAVSGGADSVALLRLLRRRAKVAGDLELVVVHLDHELRGEASLADAAFVDGVAHGMGLEAHLRRRGELADGWRAGPGGVSAWLRRLRLEVYREAVERHGLAGVLLAHHADDVAETMLLRLLRGSPGSGTLGLAPMRADQVVAGVRLLRPLLGVRRRRLRRFLERTRRPWREDASNVEGVSLRNRLRRLLWGREDAIVALIELAASAARAEGLLEAATPRWPESPRLAEISSLPAPLQRRAARRWMVERGVPERAAGPKAVAAVLSLVDAAGPRAVDLSGKVHVRRRRGRLQADPGGDPVEAGPGRAGG